ncbi:MAG: DUF1573 domain-containing protein [Planctomycetota bacterium]
MKNYRITGFAIAALLASFIIVGCLPGQSRTDEQKVEPAEELQPSQQKETKPAESTEKTPAGPAPKVVLTKAIHDFGKVGPGSTHKADYEFKNEGEGTLLVNRIQSTCGCSKPTLIKDGKRYSAMKAFNPPIAFEPGESGQIEVTFKAPATKGDVEKGLYILSNDPAAPRARFAVKAEVVVKVTIEPEKIELKLDLENAGMPDLVVKSTDGKEFSIKSVFVVKSAIKIPFDSTVKATEFTLKPEVDIEKMGQTNTGVIQIRTTHPQAGTLMVRYSVIPMYELTNPRYILQNVEPGKPVLRGNLIRSNYGRPVEIESATSRNGYMEIESQQQEGDHVKLEIKITPPARSSTARRYITDELTITLKDGQKLTVRCSGWFRLK